MHFRFGIENEARAVKQLEKLFRQRQIHGGFKIELAGLFVSLQDPYLAASPDRILSCSCPACGGRALIEIKSWYKYRNSRIRDAVKKDSTLCLHIEDNGTAYGRLRLKKNHPYYSQVQLQMHVCNIDVCYFVVSTLQDVVSLRVPYDRPFCEEMVAKSKLFVLRVILPELMGKFFTSPTIEAPGKENYYIHCCCQKEKHDPIIKCADPACFVKVYHRGCLYALGMKVFRKSWVCHICKKRNKKKPVGKKILGTSNVTNVANNLNK